MAQHEKDRRVTIRTVAEDAGVSVAAVSKVLRDAYGVSDGLRARVRASMEKLGYRPRVGARGMRGQTYTLGVLLPDWRNPFFGDIMAGVNEALVRTQYQALLGVGDSAEPAEQALIEAMIDRQMDGLILVAPRINLADVVSIAQRVPVSIVGLHLPNETTFDTVNNDDQLGGRLAVRHLSEHGHRKITYFSLAQGGGSHGVISQREQGYRSEMQALGLGRYIKVVTSEPTAREVRHAARQLLTARDRPEAVFCWTDFIALEVLSTARELGLSVPGDIAIVGYDNIGLCDLAQNGLTSIDQSGQVLGLQAARLLTERIKGRTEGEHFVVTPRLVARASSAQRSSFDLGI